MTEYTPPIPPPPRDFRIWTPLDIEAVTELFKNSGKPVRQNHLNNPFNMDHPIFGLAQHFRGLDYGNRGYTDNTVRGDHLSIPCLPETQDPYVLDISFQKGSMLIERITFPEMPSYIASALRALLNHYETR